LLNVVAKVPVTRSQLKVISVGTIYCVIKGKYFPYDSVYAVTGL
jgi:hypothetical protein